MMHFEEYKNPFPVGVKLPTIDIEDKYYSELGLPNSVSNFEFLTKKCDHELRKYLDSFPTLDEPSYRNRLEYELDVLDDLGFVDYILLNWDILKFCHERQIPTGFGRGSAAGSLVLFLLAVTRVDPLKYELFFERFVSKSRAKKIEHDGEVFLDGSLLCDVDNDIAYDRRQEVIDYIENKFIGYTCKILTLNTLSSKLCIKECIKLVGEFSEEEANRISGFIPKKYGKVQKLDKAYEESPHFKVFCEANPEIYKIARKLEGLNKNTGVHPSGIAISFYPVGDIMPLQSTNDGHLVSGYDMNGVSELMVKFDILGLRTLSVVDMTCRQLGITMDDIDPEDPSIYQSLQQLDNPKGLFQIEADTNCKVCRKVRPKRLDQLFAVIALARPGALAFVDKYARNIQFGVSEPLHPFFDEILSYTGGIPLYQEQLMKMAHKVGFTLDESEQLRRIVGKKYVDQMAEWEDKIAEKIAANRLDPKIGEILWKVAKDSANYSFNLSHSAAYGILSAITTYLKFKHPQEFFLSLLEMALHEPEPLGEISLISKELPFFNIELLQPDLSKSKIDFSIEGSDIRYGLNAMKGVSAKSLESLINFRGVEFDDIYDVFLTAKSCGLNIGILCSLIQAGALDSMTDDRSKTVLHACAFNLLTDRVKRNIVALGEEHGFDVLQSIFKCVREKIVGDDKRPIFTDRTFATFKKRYDRYRRIYDLNKRHEMFANWFFEKEILGYSYSYNLREVFLDNDFTSVHEITESNPKIVHIVGVIDDLISGVSKAKNKYIRMTVSDETGSIDCILMDSKRSKALTKYLDSGAKRPKKKNVAVFVGKRSDDALFVDNLRIVDENIYMKLSELK